MQIDYNFNVDSIPVEKDPFKQKIIAIVPNHQVRLISDQLFFLIDLEKQNTIILEQSLLPLLDTLKTFQNIETHVNNVIALMGLQVEVAPQIIDTIKKLYDKGLIVEAKEYLDSKDANINLITKIPKVIVRTSCRVEILKRFLQSAYENEKKYNTHYEYIIIDESFAEQSKANAINIANAKINAIHFDREKQKKVIDKLEHNFPNHSKQIQFLLGKSPLHIGKTYGRAWNWGILLSAGSPVIYLDDDCLLEAYKSPFVKKGRVSLKEDTSVAFIDKTYPLADQLSLVDIDPIASLAQSLGLKARQIIKDEKAFIGVTSDIAYKVKKANILLSYQGVAGEPGTQSFRWLYYLSKNNSRYFIDINESKYKSNKKSRFCWVGENDPVVSLGSEKSKVSRGIDNRYFLPPTLPVYRDEDAVFSDILFYLYNYGASFKHSWGIAHLPEKERKWEDRELDSPVNISIRDILKNITMYLLNDIGISEIDPKNRLKKLSERVILFSSMPKEDFIKWLYQIQQQVCADNIYNLNKFIDGFSEAPDYWKKDIQRQIEKNTLNQDLLLNDAEIDQYRVTLHQFAESSLIWPKIYNFAKNNSLVDQ